MMTVSASLALFAADSFASKPRLSLERVDSRDAESGRLRIYASVVELEGQVDGSKSPLDFALFLDGRKMGAAAELTPFSDSHEPLDLALVVERSALYGKATASHDSPFDQVKAALKTLLSGLSAETRVLLLDYGGEVTPHPPFRAPDSVGEVVDELSPDDDSGDLRLVDALDTALAELGKRGRDHRRLVVVIADGINAQMDRKIFRVLGDTAERVQVPIHSIAFSPADERGPLLNLGELSKRSHGTFRWARSLDNLRDQVETLSNELGGQYVLTFHVPSKALKGASHTYQLRIGGLTSNVLVEGVSSSGARGGRRLLQWVLWSALVVVGAVLFGFAVVGRGDDFQGELFILSGAQQGRHIVLSQRIVIGKRAGMLQLLDDEAVSGRHAMITRQGQGFTVFDLGSTNGTFVNGRRIGDPTPLGNGDELRCGHTRLRIQLPQTPRTEIRA